MAATVFEYLDVLGEGTSGTVYRARDAAGRLVAVKLFRSNVATDPGLFKRFRREVEIALGLEHENLVATRDGGQTAAGRLFLASELVAGGDARRLLGALGRLDEAAALSIARDVLRGLGFLDARGLVHRDVKPENILLGLDGRALLSDFGLARIVAPGGARITSSGEVIGTPFYLAPEQILAKKDVDARADVYGTGAVLFELLTGKPPFVGASVVDVIGAHLRAPAPPLAEALPGARAAVAAFIARTLEKDRDARPASPAAAADEVDALLGPDGMAGGRVAVRIAIARASAQRSTPRTGAQSTLSKGDAAARATGRPPRLRLTLRSARETLTLFAFGGDRLQLGRDAIDRSENDVCLRVAGSGGDAASRRIASAHVRIDVGAEGPTVRDLGSRTGTRLDGQRLEPELRRGLRALSTVSLGGALEMEVRVLPGARGPAAILVLRPQNRAEHAYALVRERLTIAERDGSIHLGSASAAGPGATTVELAARADGFAIDGRTIAAGGARKVGGLEIEAAEIAPGDMK